MSTFKQVRINDIIANQERSFALHPMSKAHVKSLIESFGRTGDFGVIPVRELEDGDYEQAAGHHRVEAMRQLGYTHVDCKVLDPEEATNAEMVRIMVNENNTQQGNVNPAKLDSINAIMGQVAYALLLSDTPEQYLECIGVNNAGAALLAKLTNRSFSEAKGNIEKGKSIPYICG